MSGGFFRGTSADQDTRFSNKTAKLLKTQKFAPELDQLVDMTKVKMDVMRPWIATRVTELLGFEDEVLINFIYGLLEGKNVDGKQVQIQITGFMEKNTGKFMKELWSLLTSAQNNISGIPQQFLEKKAEETRKNKAEDQRIMSELQRSHEEIKDAERERTRKQDAGLEVSKAKLNGSPRRERSPGGDNERAGNGVVESQAYRTRTRSDSRLSSKSLSRSPRPTRKRHVSRSPSRSPVRRSRSPPRRRSRSPMRRRRSPNDIQRRRSRSPPRRPRSPVGHYRYSPVYPRSPCERSPIAAPRSPRRRRSPGLSISPRGRSPPRRRYSPVYSRPSPRRRKSPAWSPSRHRRRISPRYGRSPPRRHSSPPGRGHSVSISPPRHPDRSPRKRPQSPLPSSPQCVDHPESPARSPSPQKPRHPRTVHHSPSLSPSPPHQGEISPSSPPQREQSLSPRQRLSSPSPRRKVARTPSPRRQRDKSPSPRRHMAHSPSPHRQLIHSPSPNQQRARSPSRRYRQSPARRSHRMDSPSPPRLRRKSPSPRRRSSPRSKITSPPVQHPASGSQSPSQQSYEAHESESPSSNKYEPTKDQRAASSPPAKAISSRHGASSPSLSPARRRSPSISGSSRSCSRSPRHRSSNIEQLDRRSSVKTSDSHRTREKPRKRTRSPSRDHLPMYDDRHFTSLRSGIPSVAHIVRKDESGQSGSDEDQQKSPEEGWRHSKEIEGDEDYGVNVDDRKSAKKRKKEEKRLRKEEKRRKREERHRRKEEKRANRTSRGITSVTPPPDLDKRMMVNDGNDSAVDDVATEEKQLKLENELRRKALDSIRAKKVVGS